MDSPGMRQTNRAGGEEGQKKKAVPSARVAGEPLWLLLCVVTLQRPHDGARLISLHVNVCVQQD